MLNGKQVLVTGVVTEDSIATATVREALEQGARVLATAYPRDLEAAREVVGTLGHEVRVDPLDLTDAQAVAAWAAQLAADGVELDGALHAVAFAPKVALDGDFTEVPAEAVELAFRTSVWSYALLAKVLADLMPARGGSLVGLDFDAGGRAWPVYNWMGPCKAALRETSRYVARDLGARGLRSNLVAAGPLLTRAASGIPRFDLLTSAWEETSPMAWDAKDAAPVAATVCFLLSDHARAITGEVIHVDGGYHAMATRRPGS